MAAIPQAAADGGVASAGGGVGVAATEPRQRGSLGWTEAGLAAMVFIWGLNFAVAKRALETLDPLAFNALRYTIASGFVFVVLRWQGRLAMPARSDWARILILGIFGNTLYQLAFIVGLDLTTAGSASLMLAVMPVFVLALEMWSGSRHGARAWVGAAASIMGVGLVSRAALSLEGSTALLGNLLMICAAAFWALYTQGSRPLIRRYGAVRTTAYTLWAGAAGIFVMGIPSLLRQSWGDVDTVSWAGLLYSAFLSIGLAYLLWYRGVARLGGSRTAIYSNLTPVVALAAGALWLGEDLTLLSVVGAALVIGGVMLVREQKRGAGARS
jgi:drug/metabolite transporter (DMT)-like permease